MLSCIHKQNVCLVNKKLEAFQMHFSEYRETDKQTSEYLWECREKN